MKECSLLFRPARLPRRGLFTLVLLMSGARALAGTDAAADTDYAAFMAVLKQLPPWVSSGADGQVTQVRDSTPTDRALWSEKANATIAAAALKFMAAHPTDPRHWDAAGFALWSRHRFVVAIKPGYDTTQDAAQRDALVEYDTRAQAAWAERMQALEAEVLAAPDASQDAVAMALIHSVFTAGHSQALSAPEKLTRFRAAYASFVQRAPASHYFANFAYTLLAAVAETDAAAGDGFLREMQTCPNSEVADMAALRLRHAAVAGAEITFKFTAVDGREVDLAQWRGKVVLIDFWATWCGPCKAELPNVRKVYAAYHDKGFEVVAISLDNAGDKQKLIDYCRANDLPWPQHFDGQAWKGELVRKYGVDAIPATFLLGPDGRCVTTDARGENLEREVKRLLKL